MNSPKKVPKIDRAKTVLARELIATQSEYLGISPPALAAELGYTNPNVVSMLKNGTMKLPMNKVGLAARALHLDPVFLARCVDAESGFHLIDVIESVAGRVALTKNEERMLLAMRDLNRGMDVDMDEHPEQMNEILRAYGSAATASRDAHDNVITSLAGRRKRSAVESGGRRADEANKAEDPDATE